MPDVLEKNGRKRSRMNGKDGDDYDDASLMRKRKKTKKKEKKEKKKTKKDKDKGQGKDKEERDREKQGRDRDTEKLKDKAKTKGKEKEKTAKRKRSNKTSKGDKRAQGGNAEKTFVPAGRDYIDPAEAEEAQKKVIYANLPREVKERFLECGFARWDKTWLPCLELGPYDIKGEVQDAWMAHYYNFVDGLRKDMPRLVYWYGVPKARSNEAFSFIAVESVIPYDEGVERGFNKPPRGIQTKLTNKTKLKKNEQDHVLGLEQIKEDVERKRDDRMEWMKELAESMASSASNNDDEVPMPITSKTDEFNLEKAGKGEKAKGKKGKKKKTDERKSQGTHRKGSKKPKAENQIDNISMELKEGLGHAAQVKREEEMVKGEEGMVKLEESMGKREEGIVKHEEEMVKHAEEMVKHEEEIAKGEEELAKDEEELAKHEEDEAKDEEDEAKDEEEEAKHEEDAKHEKERAKHEKSNNATVGSDEFVQDNLVKEEHVQEEPMDEHPLTETIVARASVVDEAITREKEDEGCKEERSKSESRSIEKTQSDGRGESMNEEPNRETQSEGEHVLQTSEAEKDSDDTAKNEPEYENEGKEARKEKRKRREKDKEKQTDEQNSEEDDKDEKGITPSKNKKKKLKRTASKPGKKNENDKEEEERRKRKIRDKVRKEKEREQKRFEKNEEDFLPLMNKLQPAVNNKDGKAALRYLRQVEILLPDITPSFIEEHRIGVLIAETRKCFSESHPEVKKKCKAVTGKMKAIYKEKKDAVPDGFTPQKSTAVIEKDSSVAKFKEKRNNVALTPEVPNEKQGDRRSNSTRNKSGVESLVVPSGKKLKATTDVNDVSLRENSFDQSGENLKQAEVPPGRPPQDAKPLRKKFSLKTMLDGPKQYPLSKGLKHTEISRETHKTRDQLVCVRTKAPQGRHVEKKQLPSWLTDDLTEEPPAEDMRTFALEFFDGIGECFPKGKVRESAVARNLEAAVYEWSRQMAKVKNTTDATDPYWQKLHEVVGAIWGKKTAGTLVTSIVDGEFETPKALVKQPSSRFHESFESS